MFGQNKREQWPSGCAETDWHRKEMHVRSLVAVRAFMWPNKLWCCVSVLGARARAPPNIRWELEVGWRPIGEAVDGRIVWVCECT
jgi:hypothetical protein